MNFRNTLRSYLISLKDNKNFFIDANNTLYAPYQNLVKMAETINLAKDPL